MLKDTFTPIKNNSTENTRCVQHRKKYKHSTDDTSPTTLPYKHGSPFQQALFQEAHFRFQEAQQNDGFPQPDEIATVFCRVHIHSHSRLSRNRNNNSRAFMRTHTAAAAARVV
jgi:hypothetical protein